MHIFTATVAAIVTILYGLRTGEILEGMPRPERYARAGIGLLLVTVFVGFTQRAAVGDPFLWTHWLVLASLLCVGLAYASMLLTKRGRR